jgi:hypothetical protein
MLMQIPPLRSGTCDSENAIEDKAMIFRTSPTMRTGDPATGEIADAIILQSYGDTPSLDQLFAN